MRLTVFPTAGLPGTAVLPAAAVLLAALTSCSTVNEARSGVEGVRSSAASIGAATRQVCRATEDERRIIGDLSTRLADNPGLRVKLAPQLKQATNRLAAEVGSRPELQPVVDAAKDLTSAVAQANEDTVRVAAGQAKLAIRSGQAVCRLAD